MQVILCGGLQRSKNTVSCSPCRRMSNVHMPSAWCAIERVAARLGHQGKHRIAGEHRIVRKVDAREDVPHDPADKQAHVDVGRLLAPVAGRRGAGTNRVELAFAAGAGGQSPPAAKRLPRIRIGVVRVFDVASRRHRPATARPARREAVRPRRRATRIRRRMRSPTRAQAPPSARATGRSPGRNERTGQRSVTCWRPVGRWMPSHRAPRTAWSRGRAPRCRTCSRAPTPAG